MKNKMFLFRQPWVVPAILAFAVSLGTVVWSAPPSAGRKIEGEGFAAFKAAVSKGTSNANGAPFVSTERDEKSGRPVSTSLATTNDPNSSVAALLYDQK
ncbi:hypothetical protein QT613_22475, partial [Xanthomonas citri pv. citri]